MLVCTERRERSELVLLYCFSQKNPYPFRKQLKFFLSFIYFFSRFKIDMNRNSDPVYYTYHDVLSVVQL